MPIFTQKTAEPTALFKYSVVGAICASAIPLLAVHDFKWLGWLLLGLAIVALASQYSSWFSKHMLLLVVVIGLLGLIPINTDISYGHMVTMGGVLLTTIALPFIVTRYIFEEQIITFPLKFGRKWYKREIVYVFFAGVASYFILPFYLASTGSYLNWEATLETSHIIRLFIGTNALGIWDEVFFVGVCLALLRQHLPFIWANVAQATLWTTFLYELGFQGWGPFAIFPFALSQGYIFKQSKSLLYIITVHLTIDFMLFLVLVHLHNPDYLRVFLTSPF
jgi:membrane protease YdiL (CAAX protease family)